jgi:osmotically-inducible protein OsmY
MRILLLSLLVVGLAACSAMMVSGGGGSASTSASSSTSSSQSDATITAAVKNNLAADAAVNSFNLGVRTSSGKVFLSGTVDSYTAYDHAERLAIRTAGVKSIDNQIQVEIIE